MAKYTILTTCFKHGGEVERSANDDVIAESLYEEAKADAKKDLDLSADDGAKVYLFKNGTKVKEEYVNE